MDAVREWNRAIDGQSFLISDSPQLLPHEFVQRAFATEDMSWAKPTTPEKMEKMLQKSCTVAVYKIESAGPSHGTEHIPIGMARLVTDEVTFVYLTDVFILAEYRKLGLGQWLIQCCKEIVEDMEDLRWMMLFTGSEHAERLHQREFGMSRLGQPESGLIVMGARKPQLQAAGRGADQQHGPAG